MMTIGKVAKSVGISVQAVRFYEKKGLICPGKRAPSGYRIYGDDAVTRLKFIRNSRAFGFSLSETASLVRLLDVPHNENCGEVKTLLREKLKKYQDEMSQINSRYADLNSALEACPAREGSGKGHAHSDGECRMLQKLLKDTK